MWLSHPYKILTQKFILGRVSVQKAILYASKLFYRARQKISNLNIVGLKATTMSFQTTDL